MRFSLIILTVCLLLSAPLSRAELTIQFDYTYDTSGFFSGANIGRRDILDDAAAVFEGYLTTENFGAIVPTSTNTWKLGFF
ncbi:MAG: hypothetical protein ABI443_12830, partial [Chthoniobacterales bacterium]